MSASDRANEGRVVLQGVDRYQVMEPLFECVRVTLSYRGELYSPTYIQGISGAAFRVGGICPCAPTCSCAMDTQALIGLLGYQFEYLSLCEEGIDRETHVYDVIARIKDEIRAGRPALAWSAFTTCEWDVVCGFDDAQGQFLGRGSYAGLEAYAVAGQQRIIQCADICPTLGAILIGEKTGTFDAPAAELAALREAVRHARSTAGADQLGGEKWVMLEGLLCYDRWVNDFRSEAKVRGPGDSYCLGVYRTTHRAASGFMRELAASYPEWASPFTSAASHFASEADALDQCAPLLDWQSPPGPDPERNARAAALLSQARDHYASAIEQIEQALASL